MDDVLHDLIHKVNLPAIKGRIIQVLRKCLLCCVHIKSDNFPHELAQRLLAERCLIILFRTDFAPECFFQRLHIFHCQRDITL